MHTLCTRHAPSVCQARPSGPKVNGDTPTGDGFAFFSTEHFDPEIQGRGAAIGVRKADAALRDRLSAGIAAVRADGRFAAIAGRYFDVDIYGEGGVS